MGVPATSEAPKPEVKGGIKTIQTTVGLGFTILNYTDATRGSFGQTALNAKISGEKPVGHGPWSLGGNAFSSFLAISKSSSRYSNFFGANIRAGYRVLKIPAPWVVRVYFGFYYATTFGGTENFGYVNLLGPQVFPTVSYLFNNETVAGLYLKYSPVASGFKFYTFDNREFAAGVQYFFAPIKGGYLKGKRIGATIDLAWMTVKSVILGTTTFQTTSLGASLKF